MKIDEFWAKTSPFQSVYTHGIVSGSVAMTLINRQLSYGDRQLLMGKLCLNEEGLCRFVGYLVSLHDIGKIEYSFQMADEDCREKIQAIAGPNELYKPHIRHEKTGRMCVKTLWRELGEDRRSGDVLSRVIGAHHQGKNGPSGFDGNSVWYTFQKEFEREMRELFLGDTRNRLPIIHKKDQGTVAAMLLGITILSDWISSSVAFEDAEVWIKDENREEIIGERTDSFIEKSGLLPSGVVWPKTFCELWPAIPPEGRRPLQREIEETFNRVKDRAALTLIEAPMGEGKTEAGLYAATRMAEAWGKDGLYIALPTAATANQMVKRTRAFLNTQTSDAEVRLLHSMAWLQDSKTGVIHSQDEKEEVYRWLQPARMGLLGQYAVGTIDQAMLAATRVKYGVLRLLGLTNKVLIFDEIHSYDAYMNEIIVRLLEWCRELEIPVIMLSATLPPQLKQKLLGPYTETALSGQYPLITIVDKQGDVLEHKVSATSHALDIRLRFVSALGNAERIADLAIEEVREGGCICVLMNTVREAQAVYQAIREKQIDDLMLFHAQYPAGRRTEIENECIVKYGKDKRQRPQKSILVTTQVVEQSLDVDFDLMITAIAPVDLLLQRMGRVFRHADTPRPKSHSNPETVVLIPEVEDQFGPSSYVYPKCILKSAMRVLQDRMEVKIPEDLADIVRDGYSDDHVPAAEIQEWVENQIKEQIQAGASQQYLLDPPEKVFPSSDEILYDDDEGYTVAAKTRLGEPTVRIAILSQKDSKDIERFLKRMNGMECAAVWDKEVAEMVLKNSVSVRISRLGGISSVEQGIKGTMLLSGVWIFYEEEGGGCTIGDVTVYFDNELGLLIEKGKR